MLAIPDAQSSSHAFLACRTTPISDWKKLISPKRESSNVQHPTEAKTKSQGGKAEKP